MTQSYVSAISDLIRRNRDDTSQYRTLMQSTWTTYATRFSRLHGGGWKNVHVLCQVASRFVLPEWESSSLHPKGEPYGNYHELLPDHGTFRFIFLLSRSSCAHRSHHLISFQTDVTRSWPAMRSD